MRTLHFTESFSQPTETFIKRFVEKSLEFGDVGVVAFNFQNISNTLKEKITLFEITNRLYTRKTIKGIIRFIKEKQSGEPLWYHSLNYAIETFKPDIIHCHFGNAGIMMMEYNHKFKSNIPYVTSFYGYDISSQPIADKKYRNKLTKLWQQGDGFFAEGPELIKKLIALGCPESKCLVNPLLIPVEDYPVKENYRKLNAPVKFLFIGRFVEKKGLQVFLKAVGQMKEEINEFTLDIIGNGPCKEIYEQIIADYSLQSTIKWHGILPHNEIIAVMKDYDFLVQTSLTASNNDSEGGAPTIIIEAQAIGLPVITTDHADITFIMGYTDFIAKQNDVPSLINCIQKIINCPDIKYYTQHGINKIHHLHNLKFNTVYKANLKKIIQNKCLG